MKSLIESLSIIFILLSVGLATVVWGFGVLMVCVALCIGDLVIRMVSTWWGLLSLFLLFIVLVVI